MRSASHHRLDHRLVLFGRLTLAGLLLLGVVSSTASSAAATRNASRHLEKVTNATPRVVCLSAAQLARLATRRLARLVIVDPVDEGDVGSLTSEVESGIGGIILLGSDATPALSGELRQLLGRAPVGRVPLVMVDEEGGAVQRLESVLGAVPAARTMGQTMTSAAIEALAKRVGTGLRHLGVTVDLAPVLDLDGAPGPNSTDADGTRSFSPSESVAAADGVAFVRGLLSSGVLPVLKHFPGLGGATGNTDLGPAATKAYVGVDTPGVEPFSAAIRAGAPAVMVANASVPGLTSRPASLSRKVITGLLREKLGFSGLVLTDSLTVPSIVAAGYSLPEAAVAAIRAGADEVLFNASPGEVAPDNMGIEAAIVHAVVGHKLSRARLIQAVSDAEAAKLEVGACRA